MILFWRKTVLSMISHEKRIQFTLFILINGQICSKIFKKIWETRNMLETWNLCQNVQFWILYCIPLITQFRPKVDLGPFGTELFTYWDSPWIWINYCLIFSFYKYCIQHALNVFTCRMEVMMSSWVIQGTCSAWHKHSW